MINHEAFNAILTDEAYEPIRTNPKLDYLQYIVIAGSHSYGTATPNSDLDVRGWYYINNLEDLLGLSDGRESQVEEDSTDTIFYSFHKFIKLAANCNPNIIELLGVEPFHVVYITPHAQYIRDRSEIFLSKRAFVTFAGYATQQLRRLENALARDSYPQEDKERHILRSLEAESLASTDAYSLFNKENSLRLYLADSDKDGYEQEIHIDLNLKGVPLRDFVSLRNQFANQLRNYGKLRNRNKKKDDDHLYKHTMHLIRLYYTGIDILKEHRIVTYREKEHDLLMSIRNQEVPLSKVFELQSKLEVQLQEARDESTLPDQPDFEKINEMVSNMTQVYIRGFYDKYEPIDWKGLRTLWKKVCNNE